MLHTFEHVRRKHKLQWKHLTHFLPDGGRLDDKDSVDIHDNPPLPDNVVKEEDNTVRWHTQMEAPLGPTKSFICKNNK